MPNLLLPDSAWLEHAPFAFWLVDALRPRQVVELGCYSGFSYSVFCQAVQTLGLDTRCHAIDTWLGDEHSGFYGAEVFKAFSAYNEAHYASFSQLIRSDFDEALQYFAEGSIDLLHIDGKHSYDAVKGDYTNWRTRMSDRGVILFHDTNVHERDFGVAALWGELSREYKHFEFLHGYGLGVLGVGKNLPQALQLLFESSRDPRLVPAIRQTYTRLGQSVSDATHRPILKARIKELETRPAAPETEADHAARMAKLEAELARQIRRQNFLAAVASQRAAEHESVVHQLVAVQAEKEELSQRLGAAQAEKDALSHQLAAARAEKDALSRQLAAVHAESARGTATLELRAALDGCRAQNEHLQRQIDGLHRSTSWRITRPLRGLVRALRGNR